MAEDKAVTTYQSMTGGQVKLSPSIIRRFLVSGSGNVSDQEVMMFLMLCKQQRLDPFLREAYLIKYGDQPATIVTGKEVFTKRAEMHPAFRGIEAGVIVRTTDGGIERRTGSFVLPDEEIVGGWAKVYKADREVPYETSVAFGEYVGRKKDGTPNRQWAEKPATMIRKVALVQGLREAFPDLLGGMYDAAEMSHVEGEKLPEKPVTVEAVAKVFDGEKVKASAEDVDPDPDNPDVTSDSEPEIPDGTDEAFGDPAQQEIF